MRSTLRRWFRPTLKRYPPLWRALVKVDAQLERHRTAAARTFPTLIRPELRQIHMAITAQCNLRCTGCRYGRDFMPNSQLPWPIVRDALDDAAAAGAWCIRFYGGEPLLHKDLPKMIRHATDLGLPTYVTTNGMLLEQKFDELYDAGLRNLAIGYYGTGQSYNSYVNKPDRYKRLESGVAAVRERYGDEVDIRINWLLMRPSCNREDLLAASNFAEKFGLRMQIDLIHYSLPYFTEGPDRELQLRPEDRGAIEEVVEEILRLKREHPQMISHDLPGLRSIPDWLLKGPEMKVPCNASQMIWIGADGTVQLCYVTFKLGNLHENRLSDMLFGGTHMKAGQDACALKCPNCHCAYDTRVLKHGPSFSRYGGERSGWRAALSTALNGDLAAAPVHSEGQDLATS